MQFLLELECLNVICVCDYFVREALPPLWIEDIKTLQNSLEGSSPLWKIQFNYYIGN